MRRLPVYVLADCSGSMTGAPIESVKSGIRELHNELMGDPQTVESAFLSVITFDSAAEQLVPLTELGMFNPPDLVASGTTSLGEALRMLNEIVYREGGLVLHAGAKEVRLDGDRITMWWYT